MIFAGVAIIAAIDVRVIASSMIITLSGLPGSGKSTVATRLAETLGWPRYYMGRLWRELARQRGITLPELQAEAEKDQTVDKMIDAMVQSLGEKEDNIIIESRTAFHFIPRSFKIFLTVDPHEGAERIFSDVQKSDSRNEGGNLKTLNDVVRANEARMASDRKRYQQYYHLDVFDPSRFDFVLDTTGKTKEEVFDQVWTAIKDKIG